MKALRTDLKFTVNLYELNTDIGYVCKHGIHVRYCQLVNKYIVSTDATPLRWPCDKQDSHGFVHGLRGRRTHKNAGHECEACVTLCHETDLSRVNDCGS